MIENELTKNNFTYNMNILIELYERIIELFDIIEVERSNMRHHIDEKSEATIMQEEIEIKEYEDELNALRSFVRGLLIEKKIGFTADNSKKDE